MLTSVLDNFVPCVCLCVQEERKRDGAERKSERERERKLHNRVQTSVKRRVEEDTWQS